jgi:hypothetical protein
MQLQISSKYRIKKGNDVMDFIVMTIDREKNEVYVKIVYPVSYHTGLVLSSLENNINQIEKIENEMENNVLTFREWHQNHTKVFFGIYGGVTVTSFNLPIFTSESAATTDKFKHEQSKEMLKLYKQQFQDIQKNYTQLLENSELV